MEFKHTLPSLFIIGAFLTVITNLLEYYGIWGINELISAVILLIIIIAGSFLEEILFVTTIPEIFKVVKVIKNDGIVFGFIMASLIISIFNGQIFFPYLSIGLLLLCAKLSIM